ncbi:MAG: hypothetical protein ABIP94_22615 [Planctomycetota bacterium]
MPSTSKTSKNVPENLPMNQEACAMRCWSGLAAVLVVAAQLAAQMPRRQSTAEPGVGPLRSMTHSQSPQASATSYSETTSRDLFTACDADSDDRLDLFEACDAFELQHGPQNPEGFQRLDIDRDGYLGWPEFDQYFLSIVKRGGTFRVRTCRSLVQQAPERQPAQSDSPLEQFLQLYDANRNGGLDPAESDKIIEQAGLPPEWANRLKKLDLDRSGRVEATELAPAFEQLRGLLPGTKAERPGAPRELPPPWAAADRNQDGTIDAAELARVLRSLDPSLARWAKQLLHRLDTDKNDTLSAAELPGAHAGAERRTSAAPPAVTLPRQVPVR